MGNFVEEYLQVTQDPKSEGWFIISSIPQVFAIVTLYILFVTRWGPNLMKNRQPYKLKEVLVIYNALQIFINGYVVVTAIPVMILNFKWRGRCLGVDENDPDNEMPFLIIAYSYCMIKIMDLLDTIIFVLRKRDRQITFLHLNHHIVLAALAPLVFRYVPNGHLGTVGLINCFVHVVMYSYYLLSVFSMGVKHSIWWKKYITILQMIQFVFAAGYLLYPLLIGEECGYPLKFLYISFFQNLGFFILFTNFYIKSYVVKAKSRNN